MKKSVYIVIAILVVVASAVVFYIFAGENMLVSGLVKYAEKSADINKSINAYEIALKFQPSNKTARNNLVDIYFNDKDYEKATSEINEGVSKNPDNTDLYLKRVKIHEINGRIDYAIDSVSNIKSNYVKTKLSNKKELEPQISVASGKYEEILEVEIETTSDTNIYFNINNNGYEKYTSPLILDEGFILLEAVAISNDGVVSQVKKNEYIIENVVSSAMFLESNIKMDIEKSIGQSILETEDFLSVTRLDLTDSTLTDYDVAVISSFKNLEELYLSDVSSIASFDILQNLPNLNSISILKGANEKHLKDILSIKSIRNVKILNSNINKLPECKTLLNELSLVNCLVFDITNIKTYKSLEKLDLSHNIIKDITEVSEIKRVRQLNLSRNQIDNIDNIQSIVSITELDVSNNKISDISSLASLAFLERLNISDNSVATVKSLGKLKYLYFLNCSNNNILTLEPLVESQSIEQIYAKGNGIEDISYIEQFAKISFISIS